MQEMRNLVDRAGVRGEHAFHLVAEPGARARQHRFVQRLLACEVVEHIGLAHAGLARDVADRHAVEAAFGEQPLRRAEDALQRGGGRMGGRIVRHLDG